MLPTGLIANVGRYMYETSNCSTNCERKTYISDYLRL